MDGVGVAVVRWQGWRWRRPRRRPWAAVVAHNDIAATRPDLGRLQASDRQSATVSGQTVGRKSQLTCSQSHLLTDVRQTSQPLSQGKRLAGSLSPPPADDVITRRQILWDEHSVDDGRHLHCVATFRVCTIHLVAPAGLVAACRGLECRPTRGDLSPAAPARWDWNSDTFGISETNSATNRESITILLGFLLHSLPEGVVPSVTRSASISTCWPLFQRSHDLGPENLSGVF